MNGKSWKMIVVITFNPVTVLFFFTRDDPLFKVSAAAEAADVAAGADAAVSDDVVVAAGAGAVDVAAIDIVAAEADVVAADVCC